MSVSCLDCWVCVAGAGARVEGSACKDKACGQVSRCTREGPASRVSVAPPPGHSGQSCAGLSQVPLWQCQPPPLALPAFLCPLFSHCCHPVLTPPSVLMLPCPLSGRGGTSREMRADYKDRGHLACQGLLLSLPLSLSMRPGVWGLRAPVVEPLWAEPLWAEPLWHPALRSLLAC